MQIRILVDAMKETKSEQRLFSLPNCYNECSTFDILHIFVYYVQNVYHTNVYDIHVHYILYIVLWISCTSCARLYTFRISHKCINILLYFIDKEWSMSFREMFDSIAAPRVVARKVDRRTVSPSGKNSTSLFPFLFLRGNLFLFLPVPTNFPFHQPAFRLLLLT